MVVPTNNMSNHPKREEVMKLMAEKDKIETDLRELHAVLTANHVGMTDPLVDREGFPISSIDIYQVRHARQRIICLQNDHKAVMKKIEAGLHEIYGNGGGNGDHHSATTSNGVEPEEIRDNIDNSPSYTTPICKVNMVREGSPGYIDGVRVDDLIVEFGSVNSSNYTCLADIGTVVQHSQGVPIPVKVLRGSQSQVTELQLTPRTWVGRGLIGFNIVPLDAVER